MKLTAREREIVEALQKHPLISQEELAQHFGISRSSVAVHISNLMKKGVILGKGYVFNKKVSIVVLGQVYLEVKVQGEHADCRIDINNAGFARDVCMALSGYGIGSKLITVVGNDDAGTHLLDELQRSEVDVANIYRHPTKRTCKKIVTSAGVMFEEGYNQDDYQQAISAREWVAANCDWLILETPLLDLVSNRMISRPDNNTTICAAWYVGDRRPAALNKTNLLVMGVDSFNDYYRYVNIGQDLLETGTLNVVITDGKDNMVLVSQSGTADYPLPPNQSFDSRLDLHLFLAGLVYGLSSGYPMRQALRIASGTSQTAGERNHDH